jgi:glycosyltransferase involved in cell wall biosynthesis
MRAADAMLFPSLYEGLPGAVLEASSVGLPVVASDLPVIQEIKAYLPLLRSLPLSCSNQEWAVACEKLCAESNKGETRAAAERRFLLSPFRLDRCVLLHTMLWQGEL